MKRPWRVVTLAALVALVLWAAVGRPPAATTQQSERTFQTGITGSAPAGRMNPQVALSDPAVRSLVLAVAASPVTVAQAEAQLPARTYRLDELVTIGLLNVDRGQVRIAFNLLTAADQRRLAQAARHYSRELSALILSQRERLTAIARPLTRTEAELEQWLFFVIGCVALDWDGLDFTADRGYRATATVQGPTYAYTPWMKERAADVSSRGLYWGSHNRAAGAFTFTTFGDHHSLPRTGLPDVLSAADWRLLGDDSAILADTAAIMHTIATGSSARIDVERASALPADRVRAIVDVLTGIGYLGEKNGRLETRILMLTSGAADAVRRIRSLVGGIVDAWHSNNYARVRNDLGDLTAVRRGTPFAVMYTEIWHYIFGGTNLQLVEAGLLADPYEAGWPFQGFVPVLWLSSLRPS